VVELYVESPQAHAWLHPWLNAVVTRWMGRVDQSGYFMLWMCCI